MSELARRVRERRAALGLSQEELADRMGYRSKSSITKLEKGVNDLPQSKLEELAAALDTTPAWLLGIETAAAPPPGFEPPAGNGAGAAGGLHCLRHAHHGGAEHRELYRGPRRVARGFCPDLPRQQHGSHHLRW